MSQRPPTTASCSNFRSIFDAALKTYKNRTGKDITEHPLSARLQACNSPDSILAILQEQTHELDQYRSDNERLTKWLNPTINVLYAFSATLGEGVGLVFSPAKVIFAGVGILLLVAKDVGASQDTLIELFDRIGNFFKRLEAYVEIPPTDAMTEIIVKIMVEVLCILTIATREIKQGQTRKYFKKLMGKTDLEDALHILDKLTQEEARMATAQALRVTHSVDRKVEDVDGKVKNVDDRVKNIDHKVNQVIEEGKETRVTVQQIANDLGDLNRNQLREKLRNWLPPPDPSVNYNIARSVHHKGTARWFVQGETFLDWKTSGSLLWIHGKPGSGKSILSSAIIQDVEAISNAGSAFMAYFYFDFKDTGKQDPRSMLSSLLIQLSDQSDLLCDILFSLFSGHRRGTQQPTNEALTQCLKDMLIIPGHSPIYLIVDALDECPNASGMPSSREKAIEILEELVQSDLPNLRLCVTSRPEIDIRNSLEPLASHRMSLHDESGQKKDIIDYVRSVVYSDKKMRRWRDEDKKVVIETLSEKADGMFRWVFCQLETLRHCLPPSVRRILEELPESLDETYERVLREINKANRDHAHRLLQCLTVAVRPLYARELAEVLAIDFTAEGVPKVNVDWRWEDQEEAVLSACSSLVAVVDDYGSRVIQFSHFSVKEFLTSDRLAASKGDISRYHIPLRSAHAILAQACLGVLLSLDSQADEKSIWGIPLGRYAIEHWVKHAEFEDVLSQIKNGIDFFFDGNKPHLLACLQVHEAKRGLAMSSYDVLPMQPGAVPLFYAVEIGFRGLVEYLVSKDLQHINAKGGEFGALLLAAFFYRRFKVAWSLIKHGADVNIQGRWGQTALIHASLYDDPNIVQRLLDLGADVNAKDDEHATALHRVAYNGRLLVLRKLLKHKADVNCQDNQGRTPLHIAIEGGHCEVIRLLLEHGANTRVRDINGKTPSQVARKRRKREIIRLLGEYGAK